MKECILLFLWIAISSCLISSCGSDEEECPPEAWAGMWTTQATCGGTPLDLELDITAVDENTIRIESNGEVDEIDVDGCDVNVAQQLDFFGTEISLILDMVLNGDVIDVDIEVSILGMTETCVAVLRRV